MRLKANFSTSSFDRLRSESGETMVETLVSILVSALALLMLATAIGSARDVITTSRERMSALYAAESNMVKKITRSTGVVKSAIPISTADKADELGEIKVQVDVYTDGDGGASASWYKRGSSS